MDRSVTIYPIRWRLVYLDDRQLDEAPQGSSIMESWPHAVELHLIDLSGASVLAVPIPPGSRPIFYRQRSLSLNSAGALGEIGLDATVFGYGKAGDERVDGRLWLWRAGSAVDCPPEYLAQTAIEMQLAE